MLDLEGLFHQMCEGLYLLCEVPRRLLDHACFAIPQLPQLRQLPQPSFLVAGCCDGAAR